jgi:hypothetical protein
MLKEVERIFEEAIVRANLSTKQEEDWDWPGRGQKDFGYKSKRKWQQLRLKRQIKFAKFGIVIKYSRKSLQDFISHHAQ